MYNDERIKKLAKLLVNHSVKLKSGERVVITASINSIELVKEICKEVYKINAFPKVIFSDEELNRIHLENYNKNYRETLAQETIQEYQKFDALISIIGKENEYENINIQTKILQEIAQINQPVSNYVLENIKWTLLNYPTKSMAQKAKMPYSEFADYMFKVSTIDYAKMEQAMEPLVKLMEKTDKVRIESPGTNLEFSIKGIPVVKCAGEYNIPDGEVFTAPVKESVNGVIKYNTKSPYMGKIYEEIELTFEKGKIVKAKARNDEESLQAIFATDEGAKYIGEFAIGVHPLISEPMGDILYDEKIHGSIHFTPGQAYAEADNKNKSAIHWDLVLIQRSEYGGGKLYFDDVLVREDGKFVLEELKGLNPENLIGDEK